MNEPTAGSPCIVYSAEERTRKNTKKKYRGYTLNECYYWILTYDPHCYENRTGSDYSNNKG